MSKFSGKLPDGTYTEDVEYYFARWDVIRNAITKLGYDTIAIDPSIIISKNGGKSFNIPCDIILKIIQLEEELLDIYTNRYDNY
jgi:hypothetical protein